MAFSSFGVTAGAAAPACLTWTPSPGSVLVPHPMSPQLLQSSPISSIRRSTAAAMICRATAGQHEAAREPRANSRAGAEPRLSRRATLSAALIAYPFCGPAIWSVPEACAGKDKSFTSAGGIDYRDVVVGRGDTTFDGDTIKIIFTAHTYDLETGDKLRTFDPFINARGGSSTAKGFKLTLGGANGDIIDGLNLGIVGGNGVEPMKQGGKRVLRIPPELAFGSEGHHCYLGMKEQCEVPPDTPVEIEVEFLDFV